MREAAQLGVSDYVVKGAIRWTDFAEIIHRYTEAWPRLNPPEPATAR